MNFITWQICFICLIWWQMLQAVSNIAPRGVYVCGNATSTSGLTVRKHWNLCHLVSNNLCCLMETWYSLIRRHKKTVDKIKIGLKGKQTRKFMNVIRTAMAADKRCEKFYRGLAKVTPLFQPCFAWTKICVCPAMMKVTQSARKKSSSYCIFPFPGDFVQRRLIWRLFLRGRSTGSWRSRCGLLLERFSWLAKNQYQNNNSDQSQLCDETIKIPNNDL